MYDFEEWLESVVRIVHNIFVITIMVSVAAFIVAMLIVFFFAIAEASG